MDPRFLTLSGKPKTPDQTRASSEPRQAIQAARKGASGTAPPKKPTLTPAFFPKTPAAADLPRAWPRPRAADPARVPRLTLVRPRSQPSAGTRLNLWQMPNFSNLLTFGH